MMPEGKKLLFIVNPRAGKAKSSAPLFEVVSMFSEAGYLVSIRQTRGSGDATVFAERMGPEYDLIVCYGGDGTLSETVNGLMRLPRERRPQLSYLPGGSTNDFAASLGISLDPVAAAQSALESQTRPLDVGVFNGKNFVYVASFGAFTKVSYSVPQDNKNLLGHFAYLLEGVRDLDSLRPYHMKITADGTVYDEEYLFGAISNTTSIAGMMKFAPEKVALDDGRFELLLLPVPKTPGALQTLTHALLFQEYETSESMVFRHVSRAICETTEDIPWTLDGEFAPGAPRIEIAIENNALEIR